jgi:hypothetical protein
LLEGLGKTVVMFVAFHIKTNSINKKARIFA